MTFVRRICLLFFSLLFPGKCDLCGRELESTDHQRICSGCRDHLEKNRAADNCPRCAHPLENNACRSCPGLELEVENNSSLLYNEGFAQTFLYAYKFENKPSYAGMLAALIWKYYAPLFRQFEILLIVPLNKHSFFKRDYCQVMEVARKLSKKSKLPLYTAIKKKDSPPDAAQHLKNRADRLQSLSGKYFLLKKYAARLQNKKILILDDIFTTGSTINTVAREINSKVKPARLAAFTFARSTLQSFNPDQ